MTESHNSQFKKRVHGVSVVVVFASIYITGLIDCFANPLFSGNYGFFHVMGAFFHTQLTLIVFPIAFLVLGGVLIYVIHKEWKKGLLDDKMGRNFRYSDKISPYGGAHVMEPHEYVDVAQIRKLEDCKGIIVGQLKEDGEECVDFNPKRINSHMYVTATSGSGKTYGFVKPYIFQSCKRRHSLFLTDPKGELYRDTAGFLQDNGYHVRRLDFKTLRKSDGWDCLRHLEGPDMRSKVQIFSNAVISNICRKETSIFKTGADSLLQALVLRVLLGHDYPPEKKNIKSVYQMLQNPAGTEYLDKMFDKNLLTEEELPCLGPYLVAKQTGSANLVANITVTLAAGLQLFQDDLLCDVLSRNDLDLLLPGKEPCAYYCIFPDDHDTYAFILSLFFSMVFIELVDYADSMPNGRLPVPVDFLLDEFPSIGIIPDWDRKMSTVRSRGISCVMITQDFTQLQHNYETSWATILNNCGAIVTLGINEMQTAEWISKRIGEASIEVQSTSESEIAGERRSNLVSKQSIGVGKRALFSPAEVFEIGKDNNLVIIAGRNPIFSNKTPYTIFPDSEKLREIQKYDLIDISDEKGRKLFREAETEYIRQYWASHNPKPLGDPGDLSDAMYTEEPKGPFAMTLDVYKEDFILLSTLIRSKLHRESDEDNAAAVKPSPEDAAKTGPELLSNDTAEKGAFLRFYEDYKTKHENDDLHAHSTTGFSSLIPEGAVDYQIDEETGEVVFIGKDGKLIQEKSDSQPTGKTPPEKKPEPKIICEEAEPEAPPPPERKKVEDPWIPNFTKKPAGSGKPETASPKREIKQAEQAEHTVVSKGFAMPPPKRKRPENE